MSSVIVKNISSQTSDGEVKEFFKFCGNISDIAIISEGNIKTATVTFEKDAAKNTALLLNNTQLGPNQLSVSCSSGNTTVGEDEGESTTADDSFKSHAQRDSDQITQEEKPRSRILAEYLAHGYVIGDVALTRAIDLDHKHGVSARFLSTLQSLDAKYHARDQVRSTNEAYGITNRANCLFSGVSSFFEKASNTSTGQRVVEFYTASTRQVKDIHDEARRLAELRKNEHGGSAYKAAGLEKIFGKEDTDAASHDPVGPGIAAGRAIIGGTVGTVKMPDVNTLPPSHRASASTAANLAIGSVNILPSNQTSVAAASALPSPSVPGTSSSGPSEVGVGSGPGPLRHPRPLTAAELHLQLEKEQEAVVNRLTRELTLLRAAQNASVISNSSSASAGTQGAADLPDGHLLSGAGYMAPSSRRHRRTPSNTSARSLTAAAGVAFTSGPSVMSGSGSGPAPMARTPSTISISRQSSTASRPSLASSPLTATVPGATYGPAAVASVLAPDPSLNLVRQQRFPWPGVGPPTPGGSMAASAGSVSAASTMSGAGGGSGVEQQPISPGLLPATIRYEETAFYRHELEGARRENELLRRRVRELERTVRDRRTSDAGRSRSESASTSASTSANMAIRTGGRAGVARPRDRAVDRERDRAPTPRSSSGLQMEEIEFGESAASAGLGAGHTLDKPS